MISDTPRYQRWLDLSNRLRNKDREHNFDPHLVYKRLHELYTGPGRSYHNWNHIDHCLAELDSLEELWASEIEFALFFHDAIYNPRATDGKNEEESAALATRVAYLMGMSDAQINWIRRFILMTMHRTVPVQSDDQIIVDIDLAILGQPEERFDLYEGQIRQEYSWVGDLEFKAGRSAVLQNFLKRKQIYSTLFFYSKYEVQARKNIERSLARLGQ